MAKASGVKNRGRPEILYGMLKAIEERGSMPKTHLTLELITMSPIKDEGEGRYIISITAKGLEALHALESALRLIGGLGLAEASVAKRRQMGEMAW